MMSTIIIYGVFRAFTQFEIQQSAEFQVTKISESSSVHRMTQYGGIYIRFEIFILR